MSSPVESTRRTRRTSTSKELIPGISKAQSLFMLAAGLSFLMSVYLFFAESREQGIFVGIWVPSILSAGALLLGGNDRG